MTIELQLENIRSFDSWNEIPIRPITLLVGENSSGKTTVLASAIAALSQSFPNPSLFNSDPFNLGGFESICTAGESFFRLGFNSFPPGASRRVSATFRSVDGEPRVSDYFLEGDTFKIEISIKNDRAQGSMQIKRSRGRPFKIDTKLPPRSGLSASVSPLSDIVYFSATRKLFSRLGKSPKYRDAMREIDTIASRSRELQSRLIALSPLRTKPQRTYDEASEQFDPSGGHIPRLLSKELVGDRQAGRALVNALRNFGKESGLFQGVAIKRFAGAGGPFQIHIAMADGSYNITDVGYGVSQALPVAVEAITARRGSRLIIQQPEVHLHPKAQAGLASVFAQLYKTEKKQFIVETHSDYIVDRIRYHVKSGELQSSDVALIFLERNAGSTTGWHIELDNEGAPVEPPGAYRDFFLHEQLRML